MPEWVSQTMNSAQLVVNLAALVGGAVVWKMYIENLKAALTAKSAEISSVEKNRDMWRDKAQELEKRSPEFMEKILSDRIGTREAEIARLAEDKEKNTELLQSLEQEKSVLSRHLDRTKGFRAMLALDGEAPDNTDDPDYALLYDENFEVTLLGVVAVDSGQLMITDPCYIDAEWQYEPFEDDRTQGFTATKMSDQDLQPQNDDLVPTSGEIVGQRVALAQVVSGAFPYTYNGACQATLSTGHGELVFQKGHAGAGVAFGTAFGDGLYPVYGEKHHGRITRVYINVA
jgi:hypothetical protein